MNSKNSLLTYSNIKIVSDISKPKRNKTKLIKPRPYQDFEEFDLEYRGVLSNSVLDKPKYSNASKIRYQSESPSAFIRSSKKVKNTEKLLEYFKSSDEILGKFNALPKIENKRTQADFEFLNNGMKNHSINYSPDLKIRLENRITKV